MSAPTPSSQARVGSEKKAHGAARSVQTRASPKDRPIMAPMSRPKPPQRHQAQRDDDDERPEEVVLLLDAERPEVQDR